MHKLFLWGLVLLIPMYSCVNSEYDLSNVDKEITIPVENMSLNVKMSDVDLHTVLDIEENGLIKNINGEYAVVVEGQFETEKISVDNFKMTGSDINEIVSVTRKRKPVATASKRAKANGEMENLLATYALPLDKTGISINANDINNAIKSLKSLKVNTKISTKINLDRRQALKGILDSVRVRNFSFKLPRGFEGKLKAIAANGKEIIADKIDSNTGIAHFSNEDIVSNDGMLDLEFDVTGINEDILNETIEQINKNNNFVLEDDYGVNDGNIAICDNDFSDRYDKESQETKYHDLPDELDYQSKQNMEDISIENFSGKIDYAIKDFTIDPIGLEDVPKMLNQTGTTLNLVNPQIYLSVKNPVFDGKKNVVPAKTRFEITALDANGNEYKYKLDDGEYVNVDKEYKTFYMSPSTVDDDKKYEKYEQAEHVGFSTLGNILNCGIDEKSMGIPKKLVVKAVDTKVVSDNVDGFRLGEEYDAIEGQYVFFAPLALMENSRIKYSDTIDGWNDDNVDDLYISLLKLNCEVSTDIPFSINLRITPIDKFGKRIDATAYAEVGAYASGEPVEFVMNGDIKHLDGVIIDAVASASTTETLRPDMTIKLGNVKAAVTGRYQTKL